MKIRTTLRIELKAKTKSIKFDENRNKNQHTELPLDLNNYEFKLKSRRVTKPLSQLCEFKLGDWRTNFFLFFLFGFAKKPP